MTEESEPETPASPEAASPARAPTPTPPGSSSGSGAPPERPGPQTKKVGLAKWLGYLLLPLRWLAVPLRYVMRPFIFRMSEDRNKVTFTSYSALIYTWILIPLALVAWLLDRWGWASPSVLGWVQVTTIVLLLILLGDDMGMWALVITALVATLLAFAAHFLRQEYEFPLLDWLSDLLTGLKVTYSPGLGLALALFAFSIISFYVLPKAWFVGRFEITTREVTHIKRGVAVESWRRAGRDVKQRWPDVLELMLGVGAGGVYLMDRTQKAVMQVPHVVGLWFYRKEVDRVLETIATTDYEDEAAVDDFD